MQKHLDELLGSFEHEDISSKNNPLITNLVFDSREVTEGSLFFALPGTHINGNKFIPSAIEKGACCIVYEGELDEDTKKAAKDKCCLIKVKSARFSMSPIADAFYEHPSKHLIVFGVTGTEGKSSTVSFIWQLLRLCGKKAGFFSTVQYSLGAEAIANPEHQTTPEAPIVQKELYEMWQNGCEYAVVESSSHGLSERTNRLGNVVFDCGIFMNVTLEHLEFHGSYEQYKSDKANLFRYLDKYEHIKNINGKDISVPSFGIVNLEDPAATYFIGATKKTVVGFTTEGKAGKSAAENASEALALPAIPTDIPYFSGRNIASARFGLSFSIFPNEDREAMTTGNSHIIHVKAPLSGAFNAYNLMAAIIAVSRMTGIDSNTVAEKCSKLESVKGRMSVVDCGQPFEVIVDYAHTPSSFETIFPPVRNRCSGKMICLFGSGGERDHTKRPLQGEIASKFCDIVILTDEDPRQEGSAAVINEIAEGCYKAGKKEGENLFLIADRKKAIREAFKMAKKEDIVLLLGKGHENSIIYKDHVMPYDEISEAKTALAEMGYK